MESVKPPVRSGLPLGWRLIVSTTLIIVVVMGGISVSQQLSNLQREEATHRELLRSSVAPLVIQLARAGTLKEMHDRMVEFHEAIQGVGAPGHGIALTDSAGGRILSTAPVGSLSRSQYDFSASLPVISPLIAGGQGTITAFQNNESYRAGVRREWLLWLVHVVSTIIAVSLFLGFATYFLVTKPINRLIREVRKMERGYRGAVNPGGAWEIRWLAWRFANMARELRSSCVRSYRLYRQRPYGAGGDQHPVQ